MMDWVSEFSVGNNNLDDDHREIFELINDFRYHSMADFDYEISDSDAEYLDLLIEDLIKYCNRHFVQEEAYMRQINYPDLNQHLSTHVEMKERLADLHSQLQKGDTKLVKEVSDYLNYWWSEHILKEDMAYHDFAKLSH